MGSVRVMKRSTVIIMLVTLCAGLTSCTSNDSGTLADRAVSTPTTAATNNNSPQAFKSRRTYKREIAGEATAGARGASFFTLTSSDGMKFTKWTSDYETPERAKSSTGTQASESIRNRQP